MTVRLFSICLSIAILCAYAYLISEYNLHGKGVVIIPIIGIALFLFGLSEKGDNKKE